MALSAMFQKLMDCLRLKKQVAGVAQGPQFFSECPGANSGFCIRGFVKRLKMCSFFRKVPRCKEGVRI